MTGHVTIIFHDITIIYISVCIYLCDKNAILDMAKDKTNYLNYLLLTKIPIKYDSQIALQILELI